MEPSPDCAYDSDGSSVLSSPPSATPSPPPELIKLQFKNAYPSPPRSQNTSQSGSPSPDDSSAMNSDKDGPPPRKKRRVSERPPRTTEYLDLRSEEIDPDEQAQLDRLLNVLHKRQKIVVIAGAGISVSAGIPDFRSSTGLFKSLRAQHNLKGSGKDLFDASVVYKDASSTSSFHDMVREMSKMTKTAKPTPFHHMLATLASQDRLLRLYSQNVDGIDTALEPLKTRIPLTKDDSGKWPRTIQLHGGLDNMVCSKCKETKDFQPDLFSGPVPPVCTSCEAIDHTRTELLGRRSHGVGMLRPRMVLYNEHNPDDEAIGSVCRDDLRKRPDAVIVVGTTLKVPGVKRIVREMCATVRDRRDGVAIWINNDPEPSGKEFEDCWDIVVRGKCDDIATRAALGQWDRQNESRELSAQSVERVGRGDVKVLIHPNSTFKLPTGRRTPMHSPERPPMSPMSSRHNSVIPFVQDSFDSSDAGAETPSRRKSKSAGRPAKNATAKVPQKNLTQMFNKTGATTTTTATKKDAPKRTIKPTAKAAAAKAASATKKVPANKAVPKPQQTIGFKTTKAVSTRSGKKVKDLAEPIMQPIPPEDARNNTSSPLHLFKSTISDSEEERAKLPVLVIPTAS